jgi:hypothetical protein
MDKTDVLFGDMNFRKTENPVSFADIKDRGKYLDTTLSKFLLDQMPENVRKSFVNCYLNLKLEDLQEGNNQDLAAFHLWFHEHSEFQRIVEQDASSSLTFEYLYQKKNPVYPLDNYFPWSNAGYRIFCRLQSIIQCNQKLYTKMLTERDILKVLSLASGPNYGCIEAIAALPRSLRERIQVINVDVDPWVLERGREFVHELGLSESVKYILGDIKNIGELGLEFPFDLVDFVGTLCTKPRKTKVKYLGMLSLLIPEDGFIMTSFPMHPMVQADPVTDFMMRITGWHMVYESIESLYSIVEESGLAFPNSEDIPLYFTDGKDNHVMPILTRRNNP